MMNFSGAQWCAIDLATQYGFDKKTFEERLDKGREFVELIRQGSDMTPYIQEADAPESFAVRVLSVQDIIAGEPVGHPLGLDAASSGPQLLSVLTRCKEGMASTGAIGTKVPDLYTAIYKNMEKEGLTRDQVKKATVPYVYGSQKAPERVFGEDAELFEAAYEEAVPSAAIMREILLAAWNPSALFHEWVLPDGHVAHVKVTVTTTIKSAKFRNKNYTFIGTENREQEKGMSLPANVTHSYDSYLIRELSERANFNHQEMVEAGRAITHHRAYGSDLTNEKLLHLVDLAQEFGTVSIEGVKHVSKGRLKDVPDWYLNQLETLVLECLSRASFEVRAIHDEIQCLPNHVNQMKHIYNQLLVEAYDSSWLFNVVSKLTGEDFSEFQPESEPEVREAILDNMYAVH